MEGTIDIRGIAIMTLFKFQIDELLNAVYGEGERWSIWKMIDYGIDAGEINRTYK